MTVSGNGCGPYQLKAGSKMDDLSDWFNNLDAESMVDSLADDIVVEHVTTDCRIVGKDAVMAWLGDIREQSDDHRVEIVRSSVEGSTIWAERLDRHLIDGQWHEIPVMGIIEFNDDEQVVLMRDYFDPGLEL